MSKELADLIAQRTYGQSADPKAPENRNNKEWKAGYKVGLADRAHEGQRDHQDHPLTVEWFKRGRPAPNTQENEAYKEWKRGYWAGVFTKVPKGK